jgi:hypothetical protein
MPSHGCGILFIASDDTPAQKAKAAKFRRAIAELEQEVQLEMALA